MVKIPATIPVKRVVQGVLGALVAVGVGWAGWNAYSDHRDAQKLQELTSQVQESMQHKFDQDPDLSKYRLHVDKVGLIKETETKYSGIATVHNLTSGEHQVSIEVKTDGSSMMWEAERGALLFLVQDEMRNVFGPRP